MNNNFTQAAMLDIEMVLSLESPPSKNIEKPELFKDCVGKCMNSRQMLMNFK